MIAIMIGVIITVRISDADEQLVPSSWTRSATDSFVACADQVVADERHEHEDPDQPVDTDGTAASSRTDRLEHAPHRRGRELDDEDRARAGRTTSPISTATP